jgi:hypothetical protein
VKNNKRSNNSHTADMSLPPEDRGRKAKKRKQTTPRHVEAVPAQMSHAHGPKAEKQRRDMARKTPRHRKKRGKR